MMPDPFIVALVSILRELGELEDKETHSPLEILEAAARWLRRQRD